MNKNELFKAARTLVEEIAKFGITCDTLASDRLHAFTRALRASNRESYIDAGNKIERLDNKGTDRRKAIAYALMTIGSIISKDAFDLDNMEGFRVKKYLHSCLHDVNNYYKKDGIPDKIVRAFYFALHSHVDKDEVSIEFTDFIHALKAKGINWLGEHHDEVMYEVMNRQILKDAYKRYLINLESYDRI